MSERPQRLLALSAGLSTVAFFLTGLPLRAGTALPGGPLTTVYPSRYFEVRNHDTPTKYVFSGALRVARVTGSLSNNQRVQRLRVYQGWNLCSLAVTVPNARTQLAGPGPSFALEALYQWLPQTSNFVSVAASQTLPAGAVLWLKSVTNTFLSVTGSYAEPLNAVVEPGGNFIAAAGLEAWCLTNPPAPGATLWQRAPPAGQWRILGSPLPAASQPADVVPPGSAVFIEASAPAQLEVPPPSLRIRYYNNDHLESSTVVSDSAGALVEETSFFPFGAARNEYQPRQTREPYKFTQKERDQESQLDHFGARFLGPLAARFLSTDPALDADGRKNPQRGNPYAYALNNPLKFVDPTGLYVWDTSLGGASKDADVSGDILKQRQNIRDALQKGLEKANTLPSGAEKGLVLRGLNVYGTEGSDNGIVVGMQAGAGGHTHYHNGKDLITLSDAKGWALAGTIAHEGTHAADDQAFWAAEKKDRKAAVGGPLNLSDYEREFRGFKVEAILAQVTHPKGHVSKGSGYVIWDHSWKPDEIDKNRTAAINDLLANTAIYRYTPSAPGNKYVNK